MRRLTVVAAVFTVFQAIVTNYGADQQGAAVLWLVVGLVLLWFAYRRRSRVARALVLVTAWLGVVVFALVLAGWDDPGYDAVLLAVSLGQAVPMMLRPVRTHVAHVAHVAHVPSPR